MPMVAPGVLPLAYDAAHLISGVAYDALGRQSGGMHNATNTRDDGSAAFTYDAFGQRLLRTGTDGSTVNYVRSYATSLPSLAAIRDANGDNRCYVYLPNGKLLYSIETIDNSRHFYHFDKTGSTVFLADDTGAITDFRWRHPLWRNGDPGSQQHYGQSLRLARSVRHHAARRHGSLLHAGTLV
jgi:YD repeat-containing protein